MFHALKEKIKGKGTRIVFTGGSDQRVIEAAIRLKKENILEPILLGNREEILYAAKGKGFDVEGIELLDPKEYHSIDKMVKRVVELRRGKLDEKMAYEECLKPNFLERCM